MLFRYLEIALRFGKIGSGTVLGLGVMLSLLASWRPAEGGVPTQLKPDTVRGAELYRVNCWMCHGNRGLGDGPAAGALQTTSPPLAGRIHAIGVSAATDIVMHGRGDMPGFTETLNRKDASRILQWLNGLDPVTGEDKE